MWKIYYSILVLSFFLFSSFQCTSLAYVNRLNELIEEKTVNSNDNELFSKKLTGWLRENKVLLAVLFVTFVLIAPLLTCQFCVYCCNRTCFRRRHKIKKKKANTLKKVHYKAQKSSTSEQQDKTQGNEKKNEESQIEILDDEETNDEVYNSHSDSDFSSTTEDDECCTSSVAATYGNVSTVNCNSFSDGYNNEYNNESCNEPNYECIADDHHPNSDLEIYANISSVEINESVRVYHSSDI